MSEFYKWWDEIGSGICPDVCPDTADDYEEHACRVAMAAWDAANKSLQTSLHAAREDFANEVIALITTEQKAMSRLYEKHGYGINKVCNRLKLFVGDLLKKPDHGA